jgi:PAS domain-containing protein
MTKDITERKQAEEAVRQALEQERRQRQVADSLREVATILNSSLDQPTVLAKILEQLARVIPNDGMGIFLAEGKSAARRRAGAGSQGTHRRALCR